MLAASFVLETDVRAYAAEVEGQNGFALGRMRIGARAQPVSWLRATGAIEWAGEKSVVLDAFIDLWALPWVRLSFGYGKTPLFSSAKDQAIETQTLGELSLPVRTLWPRRDLGAEVFVTPPRVPVEVWARGGNGSRGPLGNDNNHLALDARVDLVFGNERFFEPRDVRWGVRLGVGAHVEEAFDRAGIGGTTAAGFLFYRPPPVSGLRRLGEAHLAVNGWRVRLLVEGALALENRSRDTDGNPTTPREELAAIGAWGLSTELSAVVWGDPNALYGWRRTPLPQGFPRWRGGAVEVAARFEKLALGLRAADVTPGGATGGTFGVKWWPTSFFGVGAVGYVLRYDTPPLESPDRLWSWQVLARLTVRFR
ncbi:MAG: hypothetical protein JNK82_01575 [Myxococcaceae bacterium]|nr:hypothetical protein [Myxococcaceae bacterium]